MISGLFIDAPLNFPARLELLNTIFVLRLTHHAPRIELGRRIEVCDYITSFVSATLDTPTQLIYQAHTAWSYLVLWRISK